MATFAHGPRQTGNGSRSVVVRWTPSTAGDYEAILGIDPSVEPHEVDFGNNWRKTIVKVR